MKVFETIRNHLAIIGIHSNQCDQKFSLNAKNCMIFLLFLFNIDTNAMYILKEAARFQEYVFTAFTVVTLCVIAMAFVICIWKTPEIFIFIDNLEKTIDNRKLKLKCYCWFRLDAKNLHFVLQEKVIQYQKQFACSTHRKHKNWSIFWIFLWWKWHQSVSFAHNSCSDFTFISPPIWEMMLFNWHFQFGMIEISSNKIKFSIS